MVTKDTYEDRLTETIESVEKPQEKEDNTLKFSSGVVLERVSFPRTVMYEILKTFKAPKVPTYFNPEKEREEENPLDPDYIKATEEQEAQIVMALMDLGIIKGTKIKVVPKTVEKLDSETWVEENEALGIVIPKNARLRYLQWVKLVAVSEEGDMARLADFVLPTYGVTEKSTETAMDKFPSDEGRNTDI